MRYLTPQEEYKLLLECGWPADKIRLALGWKKKFYSFSIACFACSKNVTKLKNNYYNFCSECWQKYFVRPSGSEVAGMDFTRQVVRIRDNQTCQKKHGGCGKKWNGKTRRFDIHHLNGVCGSKSRSYDKIENINQLTTLCHKCHLNLPEVREKMSNASSPRDLRQKKYQRKWVKINKPWLNR